MLFLAAEESGIMLSLIRTILMAFCNVIYKLIIYVYELFMAIGSATILNSEQIQVIYNRVGLILGIVMIFRLIFSFIQYMINPDKITDKETGVGSIIKKIMVVIIALGMTDWVFEKAFDLQEIILEENTIGKIVLGVPETENVNMSEFGVLFSYELFSNFFYQNPDKQDSGNTCSSSFFEEKLPSYVYAYKDYEVVNQCLNTSSGTIISNGEYYAHFDGLEALVIGGIVLWILIMYTITLAVRVVKLAFLRIIAPIPILSYIAPKKDTAFQRWIKQCVTTYLDLFIRLTVIYFCMLMISIIFASDEVAINSSTYLSSVSSLNKYFNIILILGILLFAKKLPEILGEIFPSMSSKGGLDLGIGLKSRTDFVGKGLVKRATGAAIGAGAIGALGLGQGLTRLSAVGGKTHGWKKVRNAMSGMGTGFVRGAMSGVTNGGKIGAGLKKGFKGQVAASQATNKYIASGSDEFMKRTQASIASTLGLPSLYEELTSKIKKDESTIAMNERMQSGAKGVYSTIDAIGDLLKSEITGDKANLEIGTGNKAFLSQLEKSGFAKITRDANGNITDAKIKFGERQIRDANGNVRVEEILGSSIIGKQATAIDNEFEREVAKADNKLNTANANLVNAQTEKAKIETKLATLQPNTSEYTETINQLAMMDNEINMLKKVVDDAAEERSVYNETEFVKALKKGAYSEAIIGTYDSDDVRQLIRETSNKTETAIKINEEKINALANSNDPIEIKLANQYKEANQTMTVLNNLYKDIRDNISYKIVDSSGNITGYNMDKINEVISKVATENSELFATAINFDDLKPDGTYGTKTIKIETVYDIADKLGEFNKKLERGHDSVTSKLKSEVEIAKNSREVLSAKNADENRQTWGH